MELKDRGSIVSMMLVLLFLIPSIAAADFTGTVIIVEDADRLVADCGGRKIIVQLAGIDAPELSQPFGSDAHAFVENLVLNRTVRIKGKEENPERIMNAEVFVKHGYDCCVNEEMLRKGLAWYDGDAAFPRFAVIEKSARQLKKGLWADTGPVPPWEFRKAAQPAHKTSPHNQTERLAAHTGAQQDNSQMAEQNDDARNTKQISIPVATTGNTEVKPRRVKKMKKSPEVTGAAAGSGASTSDAIEAEVTDVLSPNEIEVTMQGQQEVIKLAGVKDCPCDFNEQATKAAHAETTAAGGFNVVDAGTIVKQCRDIREYVSDTITDEVLISLSSFHRDSSGRLNGFVWNNGETQSLNEVIQAKYPYSHAGKENKDKHRRAHKKSRHKKRSTT